MQRVSNAITYALRRFASEESGATAIEYSLIAGLIAVVIIGAVKATGTNANGKWNSISDNLT